MKVFETEKEYLVEIHENILERYNKNGEYKGINIINSKVLKEMYKKYKWFNINNIKKLNKG